VRPALPVAHLARIKAADILRKERSTQQTSRHQQGEQAKRGGIGADPVQPSRIEAHERTTARHDIVGHDIAPNATVGIGFFKLKPRYDDPAAPPTPNAGKSRKVSLGFSMRF